MVGIVDVYMLEVGNTVIDATVTGGPLRFGNHSCTPNAEYVEVQLENGVSAIFAVAKSFIREGTELTFNYRLRCTGDDALSEIKCNCGSASCHGIIQHN